jgi:hypothetical protein
MLDMDDPLGVLLGLCWTSGSWMRTDNMALWEDEKDMVAGDRQVLISKLVSQANAETLMNDELWIGCFRRTGMLTTLDGSDDDKIKPQGLTCEFKIPEVLELSSNEDSDDEIDTQTQWDADADDEINSGDENSNTDDVVVDDG